MSAAPQLPPARPANDVRPPEVAPELEPFVEALADLLATRLLAKARGAR